MGSILDAVGYSITVVKAKSRAHVFLTVLNTMLNKQSLAQI